MIEKFLNLVIYLSLVIIGSVLLYLLRKSKLGIKIGLIVFFVLITVITAYGYTFLNNKSMEPEQTIAASTTCYWVGDTNPAVWNDASHWDADSGGAGGDCDGGVVPGSDDTAVFNSANTNSVTIDTTVTVAAITNTGDYSGTMDGNTNNVNVSGNFRWDAGALDLDTGTWTISGNFDVSGTTVTAGSSTLIFNGTTSLSTNAQAVNNVQIGTASVGGSVTLSDDAHLDGNLTVQNGGDTTLDISNRTMTISAATINLTNLDVFTSTGSTVVLDGAVAQTLTSATKQFNNLTIKTTHASGCIPADALSVAGNLYLSADGASNVLLDANTNDPTITVGGDVDYIGAGAGSESINLGASNWTISGTLNTNGGTTTSNSGSSTITLNGAGKGLYTPHGGIGGNLYNVIIDGTITQSSAGGNGTYVNGTLTINDSKQLTLGGAGVQTPNVVINGTGILDGSAWLYVSTTLSSNGTLNCPVRISGSSLNPPARTYGSHLQLYYTSGRTWTLQTGAYHIVGNLTLSIRDGTYILDGSVNSSTIDIDGNFSGSASGAYTGHPELKAGNNTWNVGGNVDFSAGAFPDWVVTPGGSTFILDASDTDNSVTSSSNHFNNLQFNNAAGSWSLSDAANVDGNLSVTTSETVGNGVNLNNQAVTITGNLQIDAGKLTCGSSTVQFGGNFVHNGGTFVANTSIMKMTGGSKSITANNTVFATFWDAGSDVNTASGTFSVSTLLDLDRTFNFSGTIKMLAGSTTDVAISSAFGGGGTLEFYDSAGANLTGAGSIRCDFIKFITESANATIPAFSYGPGVNTIYATNTSSSSYSVYLGTGAGQSLSFTTSNFRVQTTGTGNLTLDAATYDPNVTITGNNLTMLKSSTGVPSISLGDGNWTISGNVDFTDGTVTPNNSTVIFTASDTDNTITSASQHFNNIQFNNAAGRWQFTDTANIDGNFTVTTSETAGAGVNLNGRTINITGNFAMAAGKVTAGGANTITVGGSWDSSGGSGFIPNTSTVDLTGTGNLKSKGSLYDFYNLKLAHNTKTTTLVSNSSYVENQIYSYSGGTVAGDANLGLLSYKSDGDPLVNTGATFSVGFFYYRPNADISVAGQNFGSTNVYYDGITNNVTITLTSSLATTASIYIFTETAGKLTTLSLGANNISCDSLYLGASTKNGKINFGSSVSTVLAGTLSRRATATSTGNLIDFGSSTISVGGGINFTGITVTPGGTVTMNGSGAQSITSYNGTSTQAFNNLTITNVSGAGVTFADSATVNGTFADNASDSKVTFNAGSTYAFAVIDIDGTSSHPVTLTSNNAVPGTAGNTRWNFNVADAAPTVSYVTVYDSNAAGGSEIDATNNGTDGGNNVDWNFVSFVPPTNDSLTFTNPSASNIAIADDNTEWNFRAVVTDNNGLTDMNYVELRLANAADSTLPYDSLKFRWTEATDAFSEIADTQNAATLTSTGADSSSAGNTWTLNFKVKLNDNFLAKNTDYSAELYSLSDSTLFADTDYANFYEVTSLSLSLGLSSTSINYGDLRPGTPVLGSTTATVNTNALNGYTLSISDGIAGDDSALVNSSGLRIKDYLSLISNPSLWSGTGLGFCVFSGTNKEAKWGTGATFNDANNKYAGIPQAATEIHAKAGAPTVADATGIGFKLDVPITQAAGIYTGSVTITALPQL